MLSAPQRFIAHIMQPARSSLDTARWRNYALRCTLYTDGCNSCVKSKCRGVWGAGVVINPLIHCSLSFIKNSCRIEIETDLVFLCASNLLFTYFYLTQIYAKFWKLMQLAFTLHNVATLLGEQNKLMKRSFCCKKLV